MQSFLDSEEIIYSNCIEQVQLGFDLFFVVEAVRR